MKHGTRNLLLVLIWGALFYVGAYFITVRRFVLPAPPGLPRQAIERPPEYWILGRMIESDVVTALFAPIHRIDLMIREDYWVFHNEVPTKQ
jgi:hypothetical protein